MKEFYKFPSIEKFSNNVKLGEKKLHGGQTFNISPKLHGTNAAIVVKRDGEVYAQSRNNVIDKDNDNCGFAAFVNSLSVVPQGTNLVIYGEWCGKGIQKGDAICNIDKKIFVIFAVYDIDVDIITTDALDLEAIRDNVMDHSDVYFIRPLSQIDINFNSPSSLEKVTDVVNQHVERIEKCDPWVKEVFGVKGNGEGVVVAPVNSSREEYSDWTFKAKTEAHSVNKSKKPAQVQIEITEDVLSFVDMFATKARFEQAISEGQLDFDMKNMGKFLKWVGQDVKKESVDELEASGLDWKVCNKQITTKARQWFMGKCGG